jgi:uncharacterized protein (TIGR03086 family)
MGDVTTSATDPLDNLSRAATQAGDVIAGVGSDQLDMPTPCNDWNVGVLIDHLVQSTTNGELRARGGKPDWGAAPEHVGDDRVEVFRARASALVDAWTQAGDLSGTATVPGMGEMPKRFPVDQMTAELAIHTWDLARGTGQSTALDPRVGEAALTWARATLTPEMRGKAFGPEVSIDPAAPLYDRLAAFFGRDPQRL